ncbi:unnamed protein product [Gongylonema pulchrum]|uniref:WD_REPEATS_REGION domain-containing protein n=1 Tax=Gongylonema pulchrum TaxID=637853 RepID=A0A183E1K8_9BILA|nr:unnamed protein product [Gongylonema pulchrum]
MNTSWKGIELLRYSWILLSAYITDNYLLFAFFALAFNPHHPHSLATGGGTTDRTVKFWNLATGTLCHSQDTMSQVNGIAFTPNYKEFITAHGYPGNELKIWKYPSMACLKVPRFFFFFWYMLLRQRIKALVDICQSKRSALKFVYDGCLVHIFC